MQLGYKVRLLYRKCIVSFMCTVTVSHNKMSYLNVVSASLIDFVASNEYKGHSE